MLGQSDLLVNLPLLLFSLLLVLWRLLNELARLRVAGLEFGLDGFVLAEGLSVAGVCGTLVGTTALCAREAALLLSALTLLAALLLSALTLLTALLALLTELTALLTLLTLLTLLILLTVLVLVSLIAHSLSRLSSVAG